MRSFAFPFVFMVLLIGRACAGEAQVQDGAAWSTLAGMTEELEAQKLELRDELVSAHLSYLSALEHAVAEVGAMPFNSPLLPLAWSRIEYLLETTYRLLENTGEYESFLKTTEKLKGEFNPPPPMVEIASSDEGMSDAQSGLIYMDSHGDRLIPALINGKMTLVKSGTFEVIPADEVVNAFPEREQQSSRDAYIQLIKSRALWLRGLVFERLGQTTQAGDETNRLGLIRDWLVLGPLESESESTSDIIYGLEELYESLAAERVYPGKNGPVTWRPFSSDDSMGRIFPNALFRSGGARTVYMLALMYSEESQAAVLRVGANAPATVCVNHFQEARVRFAGSPDPDQEAFNVWLRKGWNIVLIRTSSQSEAWGLAARFTRPDGTPFPGYVAIPTDANINEILTEARRSASRSILERFYRPKHAASLGGLSVLIDWLDRNPNDARVSFYLASFLAAKRLMEGPQRYDRELIFRKAMELSRNDPFFCLQAARAVDPDIDSPNREENLRLVLLQAAADQGSAAAMVDIGRLYLDVMRQPRRADEYADLALTVNPMSLRAGVLAYDVALNMDWKPVASQLLQRLAKRHPKAAAVRIRLGRAALAAGRHRQALTEFHAMLGIDATSAEALNGAVMAMGMLGQTSTAVELLTQHIQKFPYDSSVRLKLAELYRTLGRDSEALAVVEESLEMAPDDSAALAMRADIDRETYAEGKAEPVPVSWSGRARQELDLSPGRHPPSGGWEYLYFQVEDRLEKNGSIERIVSFAVQVHTARTARQLRHLGFWLEKDLEEGAITYLALVQPDGGRETLNPPKAPGFSLQFRLPPLRPGAVVEAEVSITRSRLPLLGDYFGQIATMAQEAPIRLSRYIFVSPKDRRLFFRPVNGAPEAMVVESPGGEEVTRIWEMNNVAAFKAEPFSPGGQQLTPCVQISTFDNWNDFARWYWRLIGGQYHSPPELRDLAERIANADALPMVKLDQAAEWVAQNIGPRPWSAGAYAFRPINARAILSRLSADGKDRTLFLCLLAREYGLRAWPVLARMRTRQFPPAGTEDLGLPLLDHFNHSLVMVESTLGGNVFMDASNPYRPPGVMPSQLLGSPGITIMPDGADRILIPDAGIAACQWDETSEVVVDEDGSILWEQSIVGAGTAAEALRERFGNASRRDTAWTDFLATQGANATAVATDFHTEPSVPAAAAFAARARLRRYAAVEEGRVVLSVPPLPGMMDHATGEFAFPLSLDELAGEGIREQDLLLPHGFRLARHIDMDFPEEWRLANAPVSRRLEFEFGHLELNVSLSPGKLALEFTCEIPGYRLKANDFDAFRDLAAEMTRWLRPVLVWEKR